MFIAFPADERIKERLDAVCKFLGMSYEDWFIKSLEESEFDVLMRLMNHPEDQNTWKWDENLCQFVRISDPD